MSTKYICEVGFLRLVAGSLLRCGHTLATTYSTYCVQYHNVALQKIWPCGREAISVVHAPWPFSAMHLPIQHPKALIIQCKFQVPIQSPPFQPPLQQVDTVQYIPPSIDFFVSYHGPSSMKYDHSHDKAKRLGHSHRGAFSLVPGAYKYNIR